jgi:hypothetical protein
MYTLVDTDTSIVKEIDISQDDWLSGNYISNNISHYLSSEVGGTPIPYATKIDKKLREFVEVPLSEIREYRDKLLLESDWRDLPSYPGDDQQAWRDYRQALRDLPTSYTGGFPTSPN